jgi:hypothetical protein
MYCDLAIATYDEKMHKLIVLDVDQRILAMILRQ